MLCLNGEYLCVIDIALNLICRACTVAAADDNNKNAYDWKIVEFEKLIKTGNRLCNFSEMGISIFPAVCI